MSKESEDFLRREHDKIFGDQALYKALDDEHQRLEDAVVAAAKKWTNWWVFEDGKFVSDGVLADHVQALIQFERENNL